ncbi:ribosome silencing factor [Brevibacterium daeguense]|uniref:Ribosomal silencing factor RsfS n=1 Tax=Brevibacterium daeguense TaxID=909936 RepID=A0ABP8EJ43_9MICO
MPATPDATALARSAARAAADKLGTDIIGLDVSHQLALTDIFVIASAASERQVGAIVDAVEETLLLEHGAKTIRREGHREGRWVLLDFSDIVVHVFHQDDREFYALERLWSDCPVVDLELPAAEG